MVERVIAVTGAGVVDVAVAVTVFAVSLVRVAASGLVKRAVEAVR